MGIENTYTVLLAVRYVAKHWWLCNVSGVENKRSANTALLSAVSIGRVVVRRLGDTEPLTLQKGPHVISTVVPNTDINMLLLQLGVVIRILSRNIARHFAAFDQSGDPVFLGSERNFTFFVLAEILRV